MDCVFHRAGRHTRTGKDRCQMSEIRRRRLKMVIALRKKAKKMEKWSADYPCTIFRIYGAGADFRRHFGISRRHTQTGRDRDQRSAVYAPAVLAHCRGRKLRRAKEDGDRRTGKDRGQKSEVRSQWKNKESGWLAGGKIRGWSQWNSPSDVRKAEFHGVKILGCWPKTLGVDYQLSPHCAYWALKAGKSKSPGSY